VDAFNLIPQLSNLSRNSEMHFSGASGQLYLDRNGQIVRQLPCAQFKNGVPTPISG
jgi:outer membrane PBP1 activator LpoA protein